MVLGLFGSLLQCGGIERANRLIGAVLTEMARDQGQTCELLSLNEPPGPLSFVMGGRQYSGIGFGRQKLKFVVRALRLAPRVRVAYLAHPNLARVGLVMRLAKPGLQYWVAAHGFETWEPLNPLGRWALRAAQGVTAPSRFTLEQLLQAQGLEPSKVTLLPHGLEAGFADSVLNDPDPRWPSQPGLILTVARLAASEPGKGVDTVIRALPQVLRVVPRASYVVVGDGDDRPRLQRLAEGTGVHQSVHFVGHQSEAELKSYYRKAEVFVMPSCQEGFGIVFLEAMAFGKPVIGAASGGIPDIVIDGATGYLVNYGDVDTLAARLIRLLADPDLRQKMGVAARQRIKENYTFDHFRRHLRQLFESHDASHRAHQPWGRSVRGEDRETAPPGRLAS
ncbi:MAG: hypothetical protein DMG26_18390 [Acidobacteria bacterium]|nr:MAG: hypothetical protein DMG26_18390 [Acidobacteriota bacterium]